MNKIKSYYIQYHILLFTENNVRLWVGPANNDIPNWHDKISFLKKLKAGTSLVVQWLRLCTSTERGMGSISSQGTKFPHVVLPPRKIRSDQSLTRVQLFATPWVTARQASISITSSQSSLRLTSIESVMPSSHLILCHPLLLLPPIPPNIRVFSNEAILRMRWPKYWSFSFSIIPSKEIPGLISFRMDWLDLHAVQGTLKSLLQHHSPKASILRRSAFFTVQLSHPYMTTGKTIALTRWWFGEGKHENPFTRETSQCVQPRLSNSQQNLDTPGLCTLVGKKLGHDIHLRGTHITCYRSVPISCMKSTKFKPMRKSK